MLVVSATYAVAAGAFLLGTALVAILLRTEAVAAHTDALRILYAIPAAAGVAYALMSMDVGTITVGGVEVRVLRYVDWLITTPVLIWFVGYVANAPRRIVLGAAAIDAVMIVFGFVATVAVGPIKYASFAASTGCFLVLLVALYWSLPTYAAELSSERRRLFGLLQNHVGLLWIAYPVVWLASPIGLNLVAPTGVELIIPYLDVVAKVPYIYFVYIHREAFTGSETLDTTTLNPQVSTGAD